MTTVDDPDALRARLAELAAEHRALDTAIENALLVAPSDELGLRRLKKQKLQLKDRIALIASILEPDIEA